jgi:hypothetical protein
VVSKILWTGATMYTAVVVTRSTGPNRWRVLAHINVQDDQKVSMHLIITVKKTHKNILNSFSRMALRLIQRICLWHSWMTCLRTESFLQPFGLQDLWIFLHLIFYLGCDTKTQCIQTIPTQLMIWRWPIQNTFGMWTMLYWTRSSRTKHFCCQHTLHKA